MTIKERVGKRFFEERKESINQNNASSSFIIDLTLQEIIKDLEEIREHGMWKNFVEYIEKLKEMIE